MSASSGIVVSKEAQEFFASARERNARLVKFQIEGEVIVARSEHAAAASHEEDFAMVQQNLDESPCYLCFRVDNRSSPDQWIFVVYVPGSSKVRDRTLYASSRESCKRDLGFSFFFDELYANLPEELTWKEYLAKLAHDQAEAPVTADEKALEEEKAAERDMTKQSTASLSFPMTDDAHASLAKIAAGEHGYSQLRLNVDKEEIELVEEAKEDVLAEIVSRLPPNEPRFVFFKYTHSFGDEIQSPLLFLYVCPESSNIKHKMVYSTCKAPFLMAASVLGIKPEKCFELRDLPDITTQTLHLELHPQDSRSLAASAAAAAKPSRPGKGGRKLH